MSVSTNLPGALLGVFVGDAAGAPLEFFPPHEITDALLDNAMHQRGGGHLRTGPGQVTDDSELTLALASSLTDRVIDLSAIRRAYHAWFKSAPFDIGRTCRNAFESPRYSVSALNADSEANGALMRVVPLALRLADQDPDHLERVVTAECSLSHPNPVCIDCNVLYCLAIGHLVTHSTDTVGQRVSGAVACVEDFIARPGPRPVSPKVVGWFRNTTRPWDDQHRLGPHAGHVKHAFTLAFHFLRSATPFEDAIRETLRCGGDTDTNAAIVGGMLGALHGAEGIPKYMADPVLQFDCTTCTVGNRRPRQYSVRHFAVSK